MFVNLTFLDSGKALVSGLHAENLDLKETSGLIASDIYRTTIINIIFISCYQKRYKTIELDTIKQQNRKRKV